MEVALETLSNEIQHRGSDTDNAAKRRISDKLRELQYAVEPSEDVMQRLIYSNLTLASVRVGLDLKIFEILSKSEQPLSTSTLAETCGATPVLLGRFLRHHASMGMIREIAQDTFAVNSTTRALAAPEIQAGLYFFNEVFMPTFQALPQSLLETSTRIPTTLSRPLSTKYGRLLSFLGCNQHSREREQFSIFMRAQRSSVPTCFTVLSLEDAGPTFPDDHVLFVDIGGASGQQCAAVRERTSSMRGRVVLQDLPAVVEDARRLGMVAEGVEVMGYNFFEPQPIAGARYYYLRAILHDYADARCLQILKRVSDAMAEQSTLLLDELVVPRQAVPWQVAQTDMTMMAIASMERTEEEWRVLLMKAEFRVERIVVYAESFGLSVTVAKKGLQE